MTEKVTAGEQNYTGQLGTAYLQDSWRVLPNLTLKFGVRYDQVSYDNNQGPTSPRRCLGHHKRRQKRGTG